MERIVSQEERIRRAEEIVALRRMARDGYRDERIYNRKDSSIKDEPPTRKNFVIRKMIKQIIVCLAIYTVFFVVKNQNFIFSQDFINKTKEVLSYDVNFMELYNNGMLLIQQNNNNQEEENSGAVEEKNKEKEEGKQEKIKEDKDTAIDKKEEKTEDKIKEEKEETKKTSKEDTKKEPVKELSQMEKDAKYVKEKFSIVKPTEGFVSSEFGEREQTSPVVTEVHKGIDIGANTGTKIVAAMDGVVDIATTSSSYGNYIQITNRDVTTIYAHCNKLYVEVGEKVKKGQKIAEVGSTGASTGPHLHFEIKVSNRHINPRLVIKF